ncbi:RagB/SusD family nutrient uptake outer membrane protein [Echinicola shivajiensis]|uniref:RagB/SusD family nutrient uptake outer membrane protein n=1 Tax=Echinicola shivajiensis TaxID=1035916 RepID=UPI001BFC3059|nr:RagB/SusD family nutrient uptake outer membrane protein [Echinicola shivajiensis]
MKNKFNPIYTIMIISIVHLLCSCESFLDEKPDKGITVPVTLSEIMALLDNAFIFNSTPTLQIIASDEYYNTTEGWESYPSTMVQRAHLRQFDTMFEGVDNVTEWSNPYEQIFYANIALEQVEKVIPKNPEEEHLKQVITGSGLFNRAYALFHLAINYAPSNVNGTVSDGNGIPLPLDPDINQDHPISDLGDTYQRIIDDLETAISLLDENTAYATRPSLPAAHALLARVYLSMNSFENALFHAQKALQIHDDLLDFQILDGTMTYPFHLANKEVIYHSEAYSYSGFARSQETRIDTLLYRSYDNEDLRKTLFYVKRDNGAINFRGSFASGYDHFTGLTTGELYLVIAECKAMLGDMDGSIDAMETLLKSRYLNGNIPPWPDFTEDSLIEKVLLERKKELVFRGLRWSDLKRYIASGVTEVALKRVIDGQEYSLEPSMENLVFPIPKEESLF